MTPTLRSEGVAKCSEPAQSKRRPARQRSGGSMGIANFILEGTKVQFEHEQIEPVRGAPDRRLSY